MQAPKMTDLIIEETSGVDHPAHLHEGWLVVKTANIEPVADVLKALPDPVEENMADEDTTEVVVEATPPDNAPSGDAGSADGGATADELAMAEAKITELEARIAELEAALSTTAASADEVQDSAEDAEDVALAKAAPEVREMIVKARQEREEALGALAKEREDRADADAIAKARDAYKNLSGVDAEKVGPALRRLAISDPELAKSVEDALAAADAQQESASIFAEIGKNASTKTDAYSKMTALAKAKVDAGEFATVEKAFAAVTSENPALYNDYLNEKGA